MKISKTPDREYAREVQRRIKQNGGFCISKLERTPDTKCICKEFREQVEGCCACGLYIKSND